MCVLGALIAGKAVAQTSDIVDRLNLRVCSDAAKMPYSNDKGEGYENKIAELIARELKVPVQYTWFPDATGFVRMTLNAGRCDIIIGTAQGDELTQSTNAYLRASYVAVIATGGPLDGLVNLDDPRLKGKRIAIKAGSPPSDILSGNGLLGNLAVYKYIIDRRYERSQDEQMVEDLEAGKVDVAIGWGPAIGYYAKRSGAKLKVVPLVKETKGPRMVYRITLGVRLSDQDWKRELNGVLAKLQPEIDKVLVDYGVPVLTEQNEQVMQ